MSSFATSSSIAVRTPAGSKSPDASRTPATVGALPLASGARRLIGLLAACAAALVLSGCEGGERSGAQAATSGAATSEDATSEAATSGASASEAAAEAGAWTGSLADWYAGALDETTLAELEDVRRATADWISPEGAMDDGYVLFWAAPSGDMVRYVDRAVVGEDGSSALDSEVVRDRPEILVYTRADEGARGSSGWRLAAVEYALPKTEDGSTRPAEARALFTGVPSARWREHPTRQTLALNVKWTGYGECHYEGGAEVALTEGPGYTFVRLPPGAMSGESWDGPPVTPDDCAPVFEGQDLLLVHGKWWMLRAWIGAENPRGPFRRSAPDA